MSEKEVENVKEEELQELPEDSEDTDWEAEAKKYHRIAKQRGKKLKEAEKVKAEKETKKEQPQEQDKALQLEDPYGPVSRLWLKSEDITHPDDQKVVMDEAFRLKMSVEEVAQMQHIKSKIQGQQDERAVQAAMPKGAKRTGKATPNTVEYHLAKGTTPDDQELAEKVIEARMRRETSNQFSDELFTG